MNSHTGTTVTYAAALMWSSLALAFALLGGNPPKITDFSTRARGRISVTRPDTPPGQLQLIAGVGLGAMIFALIGGVVGVVTGLVLGSAAYPAVGWLYRRSQRPISLADDSTPLTLDLLAAALRAGQPLSAALTAVSEVAAPRLGQLLDHVSGLLRLGAEPSTAWQRIAEDPSLRELARTAARSAESGIRLADGFEQLATELRLQRRTQARVRAERAGVWAIAPLGLCFLPAFVCLGIAPIIVGVARDVFSSIAT